MSDLTLGYVNFFVTDFERSLRFFRDQLGLRVITEDAGFGYASFATGSASIAFAVVADDEQLVGRHTGIGLMTADANLAYEQLSAAGVEFVEPPKEQPWGGFMGLFRDPDGNVFYLDQVQEDHP